MVVFSGGDCGTKTQDTSVYFFDMSELVEPSLEHRVLCLALYE